MTELSWWSKTLRRVRLICGIGACMAIILFSTFAPSAATVSPQVEVLNGVIGRAYLEGKWNSSPANQKSHADAVAILRAKGYKPTDKVFVYRVVAGQPDSVAAKLLSLVSLRALAQSYSDSSGEVWFSSWDDGDDSTWEGELGGYEYETGNGSDGSSQFYVNDGTLVWGSAETEFYYRYYPPFIRWNTRTNNCAFSGCGGAAIGCMGPGWPGCFIGWCGGTYLFCAVQNWKGDQQDWLQQMCQQNKSYC